MTKERTLDGMKVYRTGRGVYQCSSDSTLGVEYTVDIMANDGLGQCTCPHFEGRLFKRYERCGIAFDSFRCKHLRRVRNHVLDQIIAHELQKEKRKSLTRNRQPSYS